MAQRVTNQDHQRENGEQERMVRYNATRSTLRILTNLKTVVRVTVPWVRIPTLSASLCATLLILLENMERLAGYLSPYQ